MKKKGTKPSSKKGLSAGNTAVHNAFIQHLQPLKRFVGRFLHSVQDIEDVTQEAFLRAYNAEKSKEIEQPKSFLFRIAKNLALTELSKKSREITDYIEDFESPDVLLEGDSLDDEIIAKQSLGILCEAVAELPPQRRRVYLMRKVYGMPHKEIAAHLNISVSTVEKHLIQGVRQCDLYVREKTNTENNANTASPESKKGRTR